MIALEHWILIWSIADSHMMRICGTKMYYIAQSCTLHSSKFSGPREGTARSTSQSHGPADQPLLQGTKERPITVLYHVVFANQEMQDFQLYLKDLHKWRSLFAWSLFKQPEVLPFLVCKNHVTEHSKSVGGLLFTQFWSGESGSIQLLSASGWRKVWQTWGKGHPASAAHPPPAAAGWISPLHG